MDPNGRPFYIFTAIFTNLYNTFLFSARNSTPLTRTSTRHPNTHGFIGSIFSSQEPVTAFVLGLFCAMFSSLSLVSILIIKRGQLPWAVRIWLSLLIHPAHCFMGVVGIWVSFTPHKEFLHSQPCPAAVLAVLSSFWCLQLATLAVTVASVFYRLLCLIESGCRFPTNYVNTDPIERFCLDSCNCLLLALATVVLVYTLSILASTFTLISIVMTKNNFLGDYLPNCVDMSQKWDTASRQWVGLAVFNVAAFVVLAIGFLAFCQWKERHVQQVRDIQAPGEPDGHPIRLAVVANRPLVVAAMSSRVQRPTPMHQRNEPIRNTDSRHPNGPVGLRGNPRQMEPNEEVEEESLVTESDDWKSSEGEEEEMGDEEASEEIREESPLAAHENNDRGNKNREQQAVHDNKIVDTWKEGRIDAQANPQTPVRYDQTGGQENAPGRPDSRDNDRASGSVRVNEASERRVTRGTGYLSRDAFLRADDNRQDVYVGEPPVPLPVYPNNQARDERKNKPRFPFSKVDHRPLEVPAVQTARRRRSPFPYHTVLSLTAGTYLAVYGPLSYYMIFSPVGPIFAFSNTALSIFCHLALIKGIIDSLIYLVASHV